MALGRDQSPHGRGTPMGWARTASNSHLLSARRYYQGGPSRGSAGLTRLSETKLVRHRRPARTELAPSHAVATTPRDERPSPHALPESGPSPRGPRSAAALNA